MMSLIASLIFASVIQASAQTSAAELPSFEPVEKNLELRAFLSQGALLSTKNNILKNSMQGTTALSEVGFTVNKQINPNLRAGLQVFARDVGGSGDFDAKFDWFLFAYRWRDWLGISAGRIKLPFGFFNDTSDIDAARDPVLLPQSIYPVSNRDYLLAQTGFELFGYIDMRSFGDLEYRVYRGTINIDAPATSAASPIELLSYNIPFVKGARLIWETPVEGLRLGASYQELQVDLNIFYKGPLTIVGAKFPVSMGVASVEYANDKLQLVAEYSRWWVNLSSNTPGLLPSASEASERYYGLASFRAGASTRTGVYYSVLKPNVEVQSAPKDYSKDLAMFVRWDVNPNWIVKMEGHYLDGTSGLSSANNGDVAAADLDSQWGMLVFKTTVLF